MEGKARQGTEHTKAREQKWNKRKENQEQLLEGNNNVFIALTTTG